MDPFAEDDPFGTSGNDMQSYDQAVVLPQDEFAGFGAGDAFGYSVPASGGFGDGFGDVSFASSLEAVALPPVALPVAQPVAEEVAFQDDGFGLDASSAASFAATHAHTHEGDGGRDAENAFASSSHAAAAALHSAGAEFDAHAHAHPEEDEFGVAVPPAVAVPGPINHASAPAVTTMLSPPATAFGISEEPFMSPEARTHGLPQPRAQEGNPFASTTSAGSFSGFSPAQQAALEAATSPVTALSARSTRSDGQAGALPVPSFPSAHHSETAHSASTSLLGAPALEASAVDTSNPLTSPASTQSFEAMPSSTHSSAHTNVSAQGPDEQRKPVLAMPSPAATAPMPSAASSIPITPASSAATNGLSSSMPVAPPAGALASVVPAGMGSAMTPVDHSALAAVPALGALARPSAPVLRMATINALVVEWEPVDGASGYYVDYELRSVAGVDSPTLPPGAWVGTGGRVVSKGSALLAGCLCTISGLQKRTDYVVRVTAVRKRRIVLPDGPSFEQTVESEPSPVSDYFRTLNPAAEVARLTAANAALTAENQRIPVLEDQLAALEQQRAAEVGALTDELTSTQEQLNKAVMEIARLEEALAKKVAELDAANADIRGLHATLEARSGELGEARAEIRHLKDVVAGKVDELAKAAAEIARLQSVIEARGVDLEHAGAETRRLQGVVGERDATIAANLSKIHELEGIVASKEKARAELASKAAAQAAQLSVLSGDKDVLVNKLTDDLGKVMSELQRVQNQLHKAQDHVAYLEPFAKMVIDIREKQRRWDEEYAAITSGATSAGASPFGKIGATRKLGPRPTLTL